VIKNRLAVVSSSVVSSLVVSLFVLAFLVETASAAERNCPPGQTWNPGQGACVKKVVARKRSPEEAYYLAIDKLEGKDGKPDPAKASALLTGACTAKHGASCYLLGYLHENARLGAADAKKALELYQRACSLGESEGCVSAAAVYSKGLLGQPDPAAAIAPLGKSCELGNGGGCVRLAEKYEQALGVERDEARAKALYQRAHERLATECPKSGPSCYQLGLLYVFGHGVETDYKKAREVFVSGCEAGSGFACYAVGYLIHRGYGTTADADGALPYYSKACDQYDNADACAEAGTILTNGGSTDAARLTALADRACTLSTAQCSLKAFLFATGRGGTRDEAQATAKYIEACQAGNALSCSAAASRIARGDGVPADGVLATQIWERACETGSGEDCFQAGLAHRDGELVKKDLARAFELFSTGCLRKSPGACEAGADMALSGEDGTGRKVPDKALQLYTAGCEQDGGGETCTRLGDVHREGEGVPADPHKAIAAYSAGCKAGDGAGCASLARMYEGSIEGVKRDLAASFAAHAWACQYREGGSCFALGPLADATNASAELKGKAVGLLQQQCDNAKPRNEDACEALALAYAGGSGLVTKDARKAYAIINESCGRGTRSACLVLANFLSEGVGMVANKDAARERYAALCDQNLPEACWHLGNVYIDLGKFEESTPLYRSACEDGMAAACNNLGFNYYTGQGASWSTTEAAAAYQRACDLGDPYGCANVGELTEYGIGVAPDDTKAAELYAASCNDDAIVGCPRLGVMIEEGRGGQTKDAKRAKELFARGCTAGSPDACRSLARLAEREGESRQEVAKLALRAFDLAKAQSLHNPYYAYVLGTLHRDGVGTPVDVKAAAALFDKACEGRDPLGCMAAGEAHLEGAAGTRDVTRAVAMFDRACAAGVERACQRASESKKLPMSGGKGCACGAGAGDAGVPLGVALVMFVALRRRTVPRPRPARAR
jgi:TPR repeat protein